MNASRVLAFLGLAVSTSACGLILGIPDAIRDDSVGQEGGKPDTGMPEGSTDTGTGQDGTMQDTGTMETGTDGGVMPTKLTMGNRPWGLAIDNTYVYWSEPFNYVIGRVGKDGSNPISLATGAGSAFGVHQLATDGTDVYWSNLGDIMKCAVTGCSNAPTKVQPNLANTAYTVGLDANSLYWDQQKTIYKSAKSGGAATPVNNAPFSDTVENFVLDNGFVIATLNDGSVVKVPSGGGAPVVLADPASASSLGLTIYNGRAYFTLFADPGMIEYTTIAGPKGATPVALMQRFPYGVTNDSMDLYWTEMITLGPNGNIKKCSLANCIQPQIIASMQNVPKWIVTDSTAIYWTNVGNGNNEGEIMKLPK